MFVKSDMLVLLLLFGGLLLAGCEVDVTEIFNRKFNAADLIKVTGDAASYLPNSLRFIILIAAALLENLGS